MQKVLIIGAGGIGSAVASDVVASGGKVFLAGRNATSLQELASELNCEWETLEATDAASFDACGDKAAENLEGLTGVVNCVGSILLKPGHLTSSD